MPEQLSSSSTPRSRLGRACSSFACRVDRFCCCSLKTGVLLLSCLSFVNACLAFAGEAALYLGMLTAVTSQAEGAYLPPGTKIEESLPIQGSIIALGLYALVSSILGFVAALRQNYCAATALYVMTWVDVVLSVAILVISWFSGQSFSFVLSQAPGTAIAVYFLVVVKSFREDVRAQAHGHLPGAGHGDSSSSSASASRSGRSGGRKGGAAGELDTGVDEDDLDLDLNDGAAAGGAAAAAAARAPTRPGRPGVAARSADIEIGDEDEDDDGDIGRGGGGGGGSGSAKGAPPSRGVTRL
jgi:hypothetical protein